MEILGDINIRTTSYLIKRKNKNWRNLISVCIRGIKETKKFYKLIKPHNPKHIIKFKRIYEGL